MNVIKFLKWVAVAVVLAAGTGSAWADRGHSHSSVHFGVMVGPYWDPWYVPRPYPYPYYPPYPPVIIERAPPVYIEQTPAPPPPQTNYWYYCPSAKGYYPYVKECPGGWQKVAPQPAG